MDSVFREGITVNFVHYHGNDSAVIFQSLFIWVHTKYLLHEIIYSRFALKYPKRPSWRLINIDPYRFIIYFFLLLSLFAIS